MTCSKCPFSLLCYMQRLTRLFMCTCGRLTLWNQSEDRCYTFLCEKRRLPLSFNGAFRFNRRVILDVQRPPYVVPVDEHCIHCQPFIGSRRRPFTTQRDLEPKDT